MIGTPHAHGQARTHTDSQERSRQKPCRTPAEHTHDSAHQRDFGHDAPAGKIVTGDDATPATTKPVPITKLPASGRRDNAPTIPAETNAISYIAQITELPASGQCDNAPTIPAKTNAVSYMAQITEPPTSAKRDNAPTIPAETNAISYTAKRARQTGARSEVKRATRLPRLAARDLPADTNAILDMTTTGLCMATRKDDLPQNWLHERRIAGPGAHRSPHVACLRSAHQRDFGHDAPILPATTDGSATPAAESREPRFATRSGARQHPRARCFALDQRNFVHVHRRSERAPRTTRRRTNAVSYMPCEGGA